LASAIVVVMTTKMEQCRKSGKLLDKLVLPLNSGVYFVEEVRLSIQLVWWEDYLNISGTFY
jgi:hypothetical protein